MRCKQKDLESVFVPSKCMQGGDRTSQCLWAMWICTWTKTPRHPQFSVPVTSFFLNKLWYEQNIPVFPLSHADFDMAKNEGGKFWLHFQAVLLQITYIPLILKCLISKSAKFLLCLLLCSLHLDYVLTIKYWFLYCIKFFTLFLFWFLWSIFFWMIALHYVLYFNF